MFLHRKANVVGIWWWWGSVVVTDRKLTLVDSGHGYPTLASGHIPGTRHQLLSGDQSSPVPPTNISCFLTNCRITNGDTFCQGGFYWLYSLKNTFILVDQLFLACLFAFSFILLSSSEVFCFWNYNHVFFCQIIEAASLKHQLDKLSALDNLPWGQLTETVLEFK